MSMRVAALALVAVAVFPARANAQADRPQPIQERFLNEVGYPQDKGETQITLSSLVDRSQSTRAALLTASVEYGLTDRWQIEGAWSGFTESTRAPLEHLHNS